jgi:hypothetical protein
VIPTIGICGECLTHALLHWHNVVKEYLCSDCHKGATDHIAAAHIKSLEESNHGTIN